MSDNFAPQSTAVARECGERYIATGSGLLHASPNQVSTFFVTSSSGAKLKVSGITIIFAGSATAQHVVEESADGALKVQYVPSVAGDAVIDIAYDSIAVAGSPFRVQCEHAKADLQAETVLPDASIDITASVDVRMRGERRSADCIFQDEQAVANSALEMPDQTGNNSSSRDPTARKPASKFNPSKQAKWHMDLRAKILKAHPEVRDLYGPYPWSFGLVVALFVAHWSIAYLLKDCSLLFIVLVASTVGMTLFHAQGSILHDSAHRLVFSSEPWATICDTLIELTFTSFAETTSYSNGHTQRHHIYLGDYPNDNEIPDLCGHFSGVNLKAKTPTGEKILFGVRMLFAMVPLSFLLDPLLVDLMSHFIAPHVSTSDVRRQHPIPWKTQAKMGVFQVLSGVSIAVGFYFFGWRSMMYHFLCLGFETNAFVSVWRTGQDVAEHNANEDDRPTNSHYYWLYNFLFLNTGYHNEHHTFPQIAGPRLPALKRLAPEYFTSEIKTSYFSLFWRQFGSHFESYRLSSAQGDAMETVCMKKAQLAYVREAAVKAAKIAALSRNAKAA